MSASRAARIEARNALEPNRRVVVILGRRSHINRREADLRSSEPSRIIIDSDHYRQAARPTQAPVAVGPEPVTRGLVVAGVVVVGLLAGLGFLRSFDGFGGDQALFALGAMKLHAGGVLYRDFWDLKQPGIFAFYVAAGSTLGFTQTGIHAFEVLWQCAFGIALLLAMRPALRRSALAVVAVVLVPIAYYAGTSGWHLTQVEPLVGLPLFLCAWAAVAAGENPRRGPRYALASGAAAGVVALFKLLLLPVAIAVVVAVALAGDRRPARARAVRLAPWWFLGLALPLGVFLAYVLAHGLMGDVIETFFRLPAHIVATGRAPFARFVGSGGWFLHRYGWLAALAVAGEVIRGVPPRPGLGAWRGACYAWLVVGLIAIAVQTQSWWEYQFLLLLPPLGILAMLGFDSFAWLIADLQLNRRLRGLLPIAILTALTPAYPLEHGAFETVSRVARERPFASGTDLERYRAAQSGDYVAALRSAAFLASEPDQHAPVFVCGNPLVYLLANREQAVAINGWALELYPPDWWSRLVAELRAARPADVFVSNDYAPLIASRSPEFTRFLATGYTRTARLPDGTWFRIR